MQYIQSFCLARSFSFYPFLALCTILQLIHLYKSFHPYTGKMHKSFGPGQLQPQAGRPRRRLVLGKLAGRRQPSSPPAIKDSAMLGPRLLGDGCICRCSIPGLGSPSVDAYLAHPGQIQRGPGSLGLGPGPPVQPWAGGDPGAPAGRWDPGRGRDRPRARGG